MENNTKHHSWQGTNLHFETLDIAETMNRVCGVASTTYDSEPIADMQPFPFDSEVTIGPIHEAQIRTESPTKFSDRGINVRCVEYIDSKVEYDYEACFTECVNVIIPDSKMTDGFSLSSELTTLQDTELRLQPNMYRISSGCGLRQQTFKNNIAELTSQTDTHNLSDGVTNPGSADVTVNAKGAGAGGPLMCQEVTGDEQYTKTPDDEKKHKCSTCGKGFRISTHLKTHQLIHTGEKPHTCEKCGKRFARLDHLKNHVLIHTKERPHQCSVCGLSFRRPCALQLHKLTHSDERPHRCATCGKRFKRSSHRDRHELTHSKAMQNQRPSAKAKDIRQTMQPYSFIESSFLASSNENITTDVMGFYDNIDYINFGEIETYTEEYLSTNDKPKKKYQCPICGKQYKYPSKLKCHLVVHSREKPYKCMTCGKAFKGSASLSVHMKTHAEKKIYTVRQKLWTSG